MKNIIRNLIVVLLVALFLSLTVTNMSLACISTTNQTVFQDDPNEPGAIPEMVPNMSQLNLIGEDPNDPGAIPE